VLLDPPLGAGRSLCRIRFRRRDDSPSTAKQRCLQARFQGSPVLPSLSTVVLAVFPEPKRIVHRGDRRERGGFCFLAIRDSGKPGFGESVLNQGYDSGDRGQHRGPRLLMNYAWYSINWVEILIIYLIFKA
jgi:hypothetical protein